MLETVAREQTGEFEDLCIKSLCYFRQCIHREHERPVDAQSAWARGQGLQSEN